MLASNHKDWRTLAKSLEHADCRSVAHWSSTDRPIDTGSTETSCTGELSHRPAACHHGSTQRASIKSSRGRIPERHRRLSRRHALSMPGFCSQTAYIFAVRMSPDSDATGTPWSVVHDAMRPCCSRVCALSRGREGRDFRVVRRLRIQADIAIQTHRAHAVWHAAYAHSAFQADQADCARLALIAKDARSAKFAISANPANPATGKATATADGLQGSEASEAHRASQHDLSVFHQPAISSPPPTTAPATHLWSPPSRPRAHASTTLNPHTVASLISSRSNVPRM